MTTTEEQTNKGQQGWDGSLAYIDGQTYVNEHREGRTLQDGNRVWVTYPVRIGTKAEVQPVFQGLQPPEDMLASVVELIESARREHALNLTQQQNGKVRKPRAKKK